MIEARIFRSPTTDTTPDQARNTRALAWAFVFNCYARKKAAPTSRPDDAKGLKDDRARTIIPNTN